HTRFSRDWSSDVCSSDLAPAKPRQSVIELLLAPRTIQWFLAFGGGLFVLGLVLWLASQGIFENKLVVAGVLGAANAAVLFGGWEIGRASCRGRVWGWRGG